MLKTLVFTLFLTISFSANSSDSELSKRELAAKNIVDAVNAKDSKMYIRDLHEDVVVTMYDGKTVLQGRQALEENRKRHFALHPDARNELVHVVQIENHVIMHDLVWLTSSQEKPANIVEIFTFEGDKITRIDVVQSKSLPIRRE